MDGLFTQEDIDNRYFLMCQCLACNEWVKVDTRTEEFACKCGGNKYNQRESRSIRTWKTTKDLKKRKGKQKYLTNN